MNKLQKFKEDAQGFSVLYAEDNDALRVNASSLLRKFFKEVQTAVDGEDALKKFQHRCYDIVITDIKMPKMDGISLVKHIKKINPQTKTIVMSAFDDKEYLYDAIEMGVFRYLKKPVNLQDFTSILDEAVLEIKQERDIELFYKHLQGIFNYQSSMVLMVKDKKPILANKIFLDFFDVGDIEKFKIKYKNLGDEFLEHNGFLYTHGGIQSCSVLLLNTKKLFHVKLKDKESCIKHFILKYQDIPSKEGYGILSFDDITELNLLELFDKDKVISDKKEQDKKAIFELLKVMQRNGVKVELHNYYKGLSITNDATISKVSLDNIELKTTYLQQKSMHLQRKTLIISETLPYTLESTEVVNISYEDEKVELKSLKFVETSAVDRKSIRVVPDTKHSVTLSIANHIYHEEISIEDISRDAIRVKLSAIPAGLEKGVVVHLGISLEINNRVLSLNTQASMYRKTKSRDSFSVVFIFDGDKKRILLDYLTSRQMATIREFKGIQNA